MSELRCEVQQLYRKRYAGRGPPGMRDMKTRDENQRTITSYTSYNRARHSLDVRSVCASRRASATILVNTQELVMSVSMTMRTEISETSRLCSRSVASLYHLSKAKNNRPMRWLFPTIHRSSSRPPQSYYLALAYSCTPHGIRCIGSILTSLIGCKRCSL
ncbi:uncharacterized protein LAESUDRAFT_84127 [Laetiporus sulphureus 93-53]|uniref:Uncharacterized protein n=1 Tax=Laetiporus sulphureus 93-53 TaxID=1314785 RepID=A0A165F354_9APHY|nr:uncharacterized protein LAESUDRAFT_84127 [Laetiporus sulphureus 93-53]KZT08278.1 hypothetical protein LAESUDRAFT_84127 [Laetiporus sulphureus 93-53]